MASVGGVVKGTLIVGGLGVVFGPAAYAAVVNGAGAAEAAGATLSVIGNGLGGAGEMILEGADSALS